MKISGKGIVIILLFLVAIPFAIDFIISTMLPPNQSKSFGMTKLISKDYLELLPRYIIYLIAAFAVIYLIKSLRKRQEK